MKRYEYDTTLHRMLNGAYFVFPWDVPQEFGKDHAIVYVSIDGMVSTLLSLIMEFKNEDDSKCYIIDISKEICEALNKGDGDTVHVVVIDEEQYNIEREQAREAQKAKEQLYPDMLKQTHLLIAGPTGSGKSVIINGIICAALKQNLPFNLILIDPKRVELVEYRNLPQTMKYASEPDDMIEALECQGYHF